MITSIGHAAFAISDLDASLGFYCGRLGLTEAFRLTHDNGDVWIVYLMLPGGSFVELFPGAGPAAAPAGNPAGYRHLCLEVDDIRATVAELAQRGLPTPGEPQQGKDGNWQYWLTDPDGNRIELMQISPDSPQAAARRTQ